MLRQDAGVQHVGIAEDDAGLVANLGVSGGGGVAVVGGAGRGCAEYEEWRGADDYTHLLPCLLLYLFPHLSPDAPSARVIPPTDPAPAPWSGTDRAPGRGIGEEPVEDRQVVAERLAAGRGGYDGHVLAAQRGRDGLGLVGVQRDDPACGLRGDQAFIQLGREGRARAGRAG